MAKRRSSKSTQRKIGQAGGGVSSSSDPVDEKFSLVIGGPFYRLQQRVGLLGPDLLPPLSTAVLLAVIAWLPPAVLSLAQGFAWGEPLGDRAFLLDFSTYARFIVGIISLVLLERIAEVRISIMIRQFVKAGLVPEDEHVRFRAALRNADRRSSSALAEAIMLGFAYAAAVSGMVLQLTELKSTWLGAMAEGHIRLTTAGYWAVLVSLPLFWFLLFRWLWRFVVWTRLLWDFANLRLRLVATHPDRCGGIGFLGMFPPMFAVLVFALSCVAASEALQLVLFAHKPLISMVAPLIVWVVVVLVIFVGPLAVFAPALSRLKRQALLDYGALAGGHNRVFERKWIRPAEDGGNALGTPDVSSLSDLGASFELIRKMNLIPVGLESVVPLLVAIAVPAVVVVLIQIPLADIVKALVQTLL